MSGSFICGEFFFQICIELIILEDTDALSSQENYETFSLHYVPHVKCD